jgi:hypothetical protein
MRFHELGFGRVVNEAFGVLGRSLLVDVSDFSGARSAGGAADPATGWAPSSGPRPARCFRLARP